MKDHFRLNIPFREIRVSTKNPLRKTETRTERKIEGVSYPKKWLKNGENFRWFRGTPFSHSKWASMPSGKRVRKGNEDTPKTKKNIKLSWTFIASTHPAFTIQILSHSCHGKLFDQNSEKKTIKPRMMELFWNMNSSGLPTQSSNFFSNLQSRPEFSFNDNLACSWSITELEQYVFAWSQRILRADKRLRLKWTNRLFCII